MEYPNNTAGNVVDIAISDTDTIRVILSSNKVDYSISNNLGKTSVPEYKYEISLADIYETLDVMDAERAMEVAIKAKTYSDTTYQGGLVDIENPDFDYVGGAVELSDSDRTLLECLVFGEAGNQGFIGAALVAQTLRDTWMLGTYSDMNSLRIGQGYSGSITRGTNQDCIDAVSYIFDQGGYAVRHRIMYFYAFHAITSSWHESQNFVIEYRDHRFFDRRW